MNEPEDIVKKQIEDGMRERWKEERKKERNKKKSEEERKKPAKSFLRISRSSELPVIEGALILCHKCWKLKLCFFQLFIFQFSVISM